MKFRWLLAVLLFLILVPLSAQASVKKILVLHTYHQAIPWTIAFQKGLDQARARYGNTIEYYFEYLDAARFDYSRNAGNYAAFFKQKYRDTHFDAVIGDSSQACLFLEQYGDFLGNIPRVYYTGDRLKTGPSTYCLDNQYDEAIENTFRMAMVFTPNISEIIIVVGDPYVSVQIERTIRSYAANNDSIKVRLLQDFTFNQLRTEIRALLIKSKILKKTNLY
jgi:hypothetical protein